MQPGILFFNAGGRRGLGVLAAALLLTTVCALPVRAFGVQVRGFVQQGRRLAFGADIALRFDLGAVGAKLLGSGSATGGVPEDGVAFPLMSGAGQAGERAARSAGFVANLSPFALAEPALGAGSQRALAPAPQERHEEGQPPLPAPVERSAVPLPGAPAPSTSEPAGTSAPGTSASGSGRRKRGRLTRQFVHRLLHEATRVQRRARRRTRRLSHQANVSAWLPRLQVRVGRYRDETLRLAPTVAEPDRWQLTGGADWRIDGQVTWQLNRLVFTPEQLTLERLQAQAQRELERRELQVLQLLFQWQRAVAALSSEVLHPDEEQAMWWDALEAQVHLDVLSGGWFSRHAPRPGPAPWPVSR